MAISSKTVMPTTFKGIGDNYGRLHPQFAETGAVFPYYRFGNTGDQEVIKREIKKMTTSYCYF